VQVRPDRRWWRPAAGVLAVTAVAAAAALLQIKGPAPHAEAGIGGVVWSDEFNQPAGAPVDGGKWKFDTGGGGFGNNERQYYTDSTRNAAHDGQGNLVITARRENPANYQCHYGRCEYTSARLLTAGKFAQAYGRFEARIKIPRGQGIWPAFWMLGNDIGSNPWPASGEIDIMENVGKEPNMVYGTLHGPGYSGGGGLSSGRWNAAPYADDFHTYTVDWEPGAITWYVDGQQYARKTPADTRGNRWVYDHPFFLLLNLAVGGYWPGDPDGSTQLPQTMTIDYVRAWAHSGGTNPPPTGSRIKGYGGRCIDIPGANPADGAPLQIWDCHDDANQKWSFEADGTVRSMGKCMDPAWGNTANGTAIQLVTCNGNPAQRFVLSSAGDLVNVSANRCVDVKDSNSANGARLQLWDCGGGANQKWSRA
jgi:beta-glucanase (GH16 family)